MNRKSNCVLNFLGENRVSAAVRQHLLGYRLDVNGTTHCHFTPNTLSCTLTQCEPGKTYNIVLVAMTTTDKHVAKKLAGKTGKLSKLGRMEYDAGQSNVMEITMPKFQSGENLTHILQYEIWKKNGLTHHKLQQKQNNLYAFWNSVKNNISKV